MIGVLLNVLVASDWNVSYFNRMSRSCGTICEQVVRKIWVVT